MTTQAFQRGFVILTAAFPGIKFNAHVLWPALEDIDGQYFLLAVEDVIKTTKELFPGSNIIAILREKAEQIATVERQKNSLKIEQETEEARIERWKKESVPMPEDCRKALAKLGIIGLSKKLPQMKI